MKTGKQPKHKATILFPLLQQHSLIIPRCQPYFPSSPSYSSRASGSSSFPCIKDLSSYGPLGSNASTKLRRRFSWPWRKLEGMDELGELRSFVEATRESEPFPSAYVKTVEAQQVKSKGCDDVEAACRSFENYLVHMIMEEGKVNDLMDVEELLYCWNSLESPVFIELVCRFYGELCKDLFSSNEYDLVDEAM